MLKHQQNQEQRRLNQITDVTKAMSFVGSLFCMTIIAIALISSSSNSPIVNNNYYHAYATTVAEKQLQGTNNNNNNNLSSPNLIRQGSHI